MNRYLKNMAKKSLQIVLLFSLLLVCGCFKVEPTYKKTNIVETFQNIFRKEYNLNVKVFVFDNTVWVYVPVEGFFGPKAHLLKDTARRVFQIVERVLLSMDETFKFYGIIISSIKNKGIDYWEIGSTDDLRKFMLYFISYKEWFYRLVTITTFNPAALGDKTGRHIQVFDLDMPEFISLLLTQKLYALLGKTGRYKDALKIKKINVLFNRGSKSFNIGLNIKINESRNLDLESDIFNIAFKQLKKIIGIYGYNDFISVELQNKTTGNARFFTRQAFLSRDFGKNP